MGDDLELVLADELVEIVLDLAAERRRTDDTELHALQSMLPAAQYTALQALASGMTVDEAHAEARQLLPRVGAGDRIDAEDLVTAMERTPGQVAFVSGPEELQYILASPFAAWRTFLHPSQRETAYRPSYNGPDAKEAWQNMLAWFRSHGV